MSKKQTVNVKGQIELEIQESNFKKQVAWAKLKKTETADCTKFIGTGITIKEVYPVDVLDYVNRMSVGTPYVKIAEYFNIRDKTGKRVTIGYNDVETWIFRGCALLNLKMDDAKKLISKLKRGGGRTSYAEDSFNLGKDPKYSSCGTVVFGKLLMNKIIELIPDFDAKNTYRFDAEKFLNKSGKKFAKLFYVSDE